MASFRPPDSGRNESTSTTASDRLDSWKDIGKHLGKSIRCVQQWEDQYDLPVHRLSRDKKSSVYAYKSELDAWLATRSGLPGEGAAVSAPESVPVQTPQAPKPSTGRNFAHFAIILLLVLVASAFLITRTTPIGGAGERRVRVRPLAVGAGNEIMPSFSPDGTRVAYVWDGGKDEDQNYSTSIYVKQIDTDSAVRLTEHPEMEWFPEWSPDGRMIAFYRAPEVMVIPAMGGRELKLGEIRWAGIGPVYTWAGDNSGLITADADAIGRHSALWFLPLDQAARVRITDPPVGGADLTPSMSPDGRTLAFTRNDSSLANNIYLLQMNGSRPAGPPRQITFNEETTYFYLTWAQDGKSLFCLRARPDMSVVRIYVDGKRGPDTVPQILPSVTSFLAAAPTGDKLAWSTVIYDLDLWRMEIPAPGRNADRSRIAHTTRQEQEPAISHDGKMLAFMSVRGGSNQLWIADGDGSRPMMIEPRKAHHPNWSPDGTRIAYEVFDRGGIDIYTIPARGGASVLVTPEPWQAQRPVWSRDGQWIYFNSNRSGVREIWKSPAEGGPMIQVTRHGGYRAEESVDGRTLYFTKEVADASLWAMPAAGGPERKLLEPLISGAAFQVFDDGIYSVMKGSASPKLAFYSFRDQQVRDVCDVDPRFSSNLSMSRDRRWVVYDAWRHRSGDLMMIEGLQ